MASSSFPRAFAAWGGDRGGGFFGAYGGDRGGRGTWACELLRKETLCNTRGEPVRLLTFRVPPGASMNVEPGLRQVVVVRALGQMRMYSPTSDPCRPDGTFDLVVRVYQHGRVSQWLDSVPLGEHVSMTWPWPAPLSPDRRNAGKRVGLVAFGVSITELYRVAVNELRDPEVEEVVLLYATRVAEEQLVLSDELQGLVASHGPRFRLERILSREHQPGCRSGRADAAVLAKTFPWADERRDDVRFMVSGTKEMMKDTMAILEGLGYVRENYKLIRDGHFSSVFASMFS